MSDEKKIGGEIMSYVCCNISFTESSFLPNEEKLVLLREYQQGLKKKVKGAEEKNKDLELC